MKDFLLLMLRVRGVLGSFLIFNENIGAVISYLLGNFCNYYIAPIFVICLSLIYAMSFALFPETPTYLMKQSKAIVRDPGEFRN